MAETFFDRFVHPRVARVAAFGLAVWLGSFAIALVGLAVRGGDPTLAGLLFFLSGLIGLLGMVTLGGCGAYLGVRKLRAG